MIDPRITETAELADIHLRVKPGRDAWLLAAILGQLVQQDLIDHHWLAEHANGHETVIEALAASRPETRYPIGDDAHFMLDMEKSCSDREIDAFILDMYRSAPV